MNAYIKIKSIAFLLTGGLFFVALHAQDLPYRISTEGISPLNLRLLEDFSPLPRFDSLVYESERSMHQKLRVLEEMYQPANGEYRLDLHLGAYPYYMQNYSELSLFDRAALEYESYRYSFEFEHGYFGPATRPKASRYIRKSIYQDLLYPWQNAPLSKFQTYRALYLITNFVYPTE